MIKTDHIQIGQNPTATQNFTMVQNADGTGALKRGNRGAETQDIITWDAAGKVTFPVKASLSEVAGVFTSSSQTIASASLLTIAHGLGVAPKRISSKLQCTVSDNGFSIGDVLYIEASAFNTTSGANAGAAVYADATNIYVRFGSGISPFCAPNKSTGVGAALTNTSWVLIVDAIL